MNLYETDAEFMERFERFAFKEIVNENGMKLDDETRYMSILASRSVVGAWMRIR